MINKIISSNVNSYNYFNSQKKNVSFSSGNSEPESLNGKKKAVVLASSAVGMLPVMAVLAKMRGFSLNPARIAKTPIKDWAIFKYAPIKKSIEFKAPQIISMASASVVGGFVGGSIVDDKKNLKAKKREILNQILGNVIVPVACVSTGAMIFDNYAERLQNIMPQIDSKKTIAKVFNTCMKNVPNAIATLGFLGLGIYLGNKVSNLVNEKIYHKKIERNIKTSDFAPHVDDLCMATSMMNKDSLFGSKLARVIPIALLVPGYETGTAREK